MARMTYQSRNREGLTYAEWLQAATLGGKFQEDDRHRKGWREGEDPTEWAAWAEKQQHARRDEGEDP